MLLFDCEPVRCSVSGVMKAFVSARSGQLCIQTSSRAPQRMINKGGDGQARCILITHKDKKQDRKEKRGNL